MTARPRTATAGRSDAAPRRRCDGRRPQAARRRLRGGAARRPAAPSAGRERRPRRGRAARRSSRCSCWRCSPAPWSGAIAGLRQRLLRRLRTRGLVTLYRGVPYELPFGIDLYQKRVRQLGAGAGAARRRAPAAARPPAALARTTPPTWSATWSGAEACDAPATASCSACFPVAAADHGGLHGGLHGALERARLGDAHLRRDLPRAVPRRAPVHPRHAARRRSVPVPAGGAAGRVRAGDDLPDRRHARAPAGGLVRGRDRAVRRRRSCCCGTCGCSSATAT